MQIIRFLNQSRGHFANDSYLSILSALAQAVIGENKVTKKMDEILSAQQSFIIQMMKHKKTVKA